MDNTKTCGMQQSFKYSDDYTTIRTEAESKWPAWKVLTYNVNFATSAHAKKVEKDEKILIK